MRPFYVFDRWGKQVDTIAWPLQAVHKDVLNGEDSLTITTLGDPLMKGQRIVWRDKFGTWHEHTVADTTTTHTEGQLTETAYCESSISELLTDFLVEVEPRDATSYRALERVLENSRWAIGTVEPTGTQSFSWYHQSAYEAVTNIVETFGAELSTTIELREDVVYARKVNIVNHRGDDYGHLFTYGRNLAGVERSVATESIYTALYGYGKGVQLYDENTGEPTGGYSRKISFADINGGQAWVGDEDAKMRYGVPDGKGGVKHAFGIVEFSECEDPEELLELTKEALKQASKPKVSYTGDVINLASGGYANGEDAQPGDTVYLRDRELDERLQGRVLEVERDLLNEANTKITLGNIKSRFTQKLAKDLADLDWLLDQSSKWDDVVKLPDAYLDAVVNRLNILFNETGGFVYYKKGEGLITYDKPIDQNPTMAIQITGAGFRIANSKNSDGSWKWRTFGTGDGFTADELITGVIKGGSNYWNLGTGDLRFVQGSIASTDGRNSWNLTTGDLQLGYGRIHDATNTNSWNLATGELSITSGAKVGNLTLDQYVNQEAEDQAQSAVEALAKERLTQQGIFDTLTNNGETQGIYLKDGRVYINASYIGTGTLQAGKIQDKAGNNYWDLETGEFRLSPNIKIKTASSDKTLGEYIKDEDSFRNANAEQVFNKLTNNGELPGIYMESGQLYINASYIKTGAFNAGLITTGKIQDKAGKNYWNLDTGEFRLSATTQVGSNQSLQQYVQGITDTATSNYVNKDSFSNYLTQRNVFNALTNGGVERGIYLSGSALYISGDYIRTGVIEGTNESSLWNLNSGYFETSNLSYAVGQYHKMITRLYNGIISLRMDATDIGSIYVYTYSNNANVHGVAIDAFTDLKLTANGNILVGTVGTFYRTVSSGSISFIDRVTQDNTMIYYHYGGASITHGMIVWAGQSTDDPGIEGPSMYAASVMPASELSTGDAIELQPILNNADIEQAVDEKRMIWRLDDDENINEVIYTGEGWTDEPLVLGSSEASVVATSPAYVDARTEVMQSEIEALASAVASTLPVKKAADLKAQIQSVRAGIVSGDEVQMAEIAQGLSDTPAVYSVAKAKEVANGRPISTH